MLLLPFIKLTTCATNYLGGIHTSICTCSGCKCPSRRLKRVADFMTPPPPSGRALVAVAKVGLVSVLMVPLTFLAVVGAVAFPGWLAFVYVLGGALLGSAIGFIGGRVVSRSALERIRGSRLGQLSRQLAKRGTIAVAVLRLVLSIAPFAVFNLVAGASHLGGSGRSSSGACWG
jgi:uncharacterized membrane protein YdjX (TVP38/TMEM64 family)